MDELAAWEQQPGEPATAYSAFVRFRDLGAKRTMRAVAGKDRGQRPPGYIWSLASRWRWRQRAAAWDRERARRRDQRLLEAAAEVTDDEVVVHRLINGVVADLAANGSQPAEPDDAWTEIAELLEADAREQRRGGGPGG